MSRKILITIGLVAICLAGSATAQDNSGQNHLQTLARRSYLFALNSEHACIRNSAVFRVLQFHAVFPQEEMKTFVKTLREMSVKDASPQNRLYAFIACTFLENENLMKAAGAPPEKEDEKEAYFTRMQGILQSNAALARE